MIQFDAQHFNLFCHRSKKIISIVQRSTGSCSILRLLVGWRYHNILSSLAAFSDVSDAIDDDGDNFCNDFVFLLIRDGETFHLFDH
jgi:hypothetical protein